MQKRQKAPSQGQILQVGAAVLAALPLLSKEDASAFLGLPERKRKSAAKAMILSALGRKSFPDRSTDPLLCAWVSFYERYFPAELEAAGEDAILNVALPDEKEGFDRLLVILPGLTMNRAYDECAKHFPCWRYTDDLDRSIPTNDRTAAHGAYAIRVRIRTEADEEHKNRSANDLAHAGVKGITLLERMLFELRHFSETGEHLDLENYTLCAGSRDADGSVPRADWRGGEFGVYWYGPGSRYPELRVREVLS